MNSKEFKAVFNEYAKKNGFESAFGGWFKDGPSSIIVLDLQKSNYGDYYELNIKIYIQGMFGNNYLRSKDLVKKEIGNVSLRQPAAFRSIFNFDEAMDDDFRRQKLNELFSEFITPISNRAMSLPGILELEKQKEIHLTPAVKGELEKLIT